MLIELLKILELKSVLNINKNQNLKEIFSMIFPEFLYLDRLEILKKIYNINNTNKEILLAVLLIDDNDNHEYFSHKYNVSNRIKENLKKIALQLTHIKKNKDFFEKDLKRNVYIFGKNHLINLNLINFSINSKIKTQEFFKITKKILGSNVPKFKIDGDYLKKNGMREGESLGRALKLIEKEWINNNFEISNKRVKELIEKNFN